MAVRTGASLAAAALMLGGCGGGGDGDGQEPRRTSDLERGEAAIRDCRVRSVVSLHSGVLRLQLKDGGAIELSVSDERTVYAAIERARPRCGNVVIAME